MNKHIILCIVTFLESSISTLRWGGGVGVTRRAGGTKEVRRCRSGALDRVIEEEEDRTPGGRHGRSETEESARQREDL